MKKEIIINSSTTQTRVAITEDSKLVDFFVENPEKERMVGDIYFGRVARILPGIKAAFVDIGLKHDAFLHFSDIGKRLEALQTVFGDDGDSEVDDEDDEKIPHTSKDDSVNKETEVPKLRKGQDILIQILKEPIGNKGVRVTSSISIPGRFCVLLPFDRKIGISKKIVDFKERRRLKKLARGIIPQNCGLIIRTAAKDQDEDILASDLKYLSKAWGDIQEQARTNEPPTLIYKDLSTTSSVIRDLLTPDVSKIFVDSKKLYREIRGYISLVQPALLDKVEHLKDDEPIFETFGIEQQIKLLMQRQVPLPSGGHIVIDHTEAMIVVDVNSGRYAAKKDQELNSLKTDLEAAREIVRQLRLRDIGGLMVIDFIDLEEDKNRKKIYDELKKEFKKDRAKIALLPMTDFGIIQITRQRIRENILQSMNEVCPYCHGTGLLTKQSNLIHEIEEWLTKYKIYHRERVLIIKCNPHLGLKLKEGKIKTLTKLQFKFFQRIKLEEDIKMSPGKFKIISEKTGEDLTDKY
ncbi:MAG: Rne/Rng family ribonuclease [Melioribacteraceae bacterium]|nr:Rne/Rng family ribonuclease [Melioribacteraceae bacterium]